jgi:hypothetical protein
MTQIASVKLRGKDFFADANAGLSAAVVEKKSQESAGGICHIPLLINWMKLIAP